MIPCIVINPKGDAATATIVGCGAVLDSTNPSFTITTDAPVGSAEYDQALSNQYELWWTTDDPNDPSAVWIDEKEPVVLGTLPGGMGAYSNFPSDGSEVTLRLRCLPAGNNEGWIDADQCTFTATTLNNSVSISNCGDTLTSATYAVTINSGSAPDGSRYDIRRSYVSANGPWFDTLSSEEPTSYPHTFQPFTDMPTDGSPVWFSLWCLSPGGETFEFLESCEFTSVSIQQSADLCINSTLTRNFDLTPPQSLIDLSGVQSFDPNNLNWRRPGGAMPSITFNPGPQTHTASSAAQLAANIASVSPNNGVIRLTGNIGVFDIPATVTGIAGQYRIIDLNGFQMGTGGRSYIRGNNIAIMDSTGNGAVGTIVVIHGNDNLVIGINDFLKAELFGTTQTSPRPTDNKFFGVDFYARSDDPNRAGIQLSRTTGGADSNGLRTVISRCTFNNFPENAITGSAEIDFYPRERPATYTIVYETNFFNCGQETTTFKDDAAYVYGGISYGGKGYHSFRSAHRCALVNHMHAQNRGLWLQAFGVNQVIAGNIVLANTDVRPLSTITPHSFVNAQGVTSINAQGLAFSYICDNMIFSVNNEAFRGTVFIDEYAGPAGHQLWENNIDGPDAEGNTMFNNIMFGPTSTVPPYNDNTSNNRFPKSQWDSLNPNAPIETQIAAQQSSANPRIATLGQAYKEGDPTAPFVNANGEKVIPDFWPNEDLVIPLNPRKLDGSVFSYT